MESDSTVITSSPINSPNDSMPPTPNSVENSINASSPSNTFNRSIKKDVTVLTNNQPNNNLHTKSNRRRHYSNASSSADEDLQIDVVSNENNFLNKKTKSNSVKKLNSSHDLSLNELSNSKTKSLTPPLTTPNQNKLNNSLNSSLNENKITVKSNTINSNSTENITPATILHSPNSNSSSNSQYPTVFDLNKHSESAAAALIAGLDDENASRKFKSFLIEDILSQRQKQQQQQQKLLLLQQQRLYLLQQQQLNNKALLPQGLQPLTLSDPSSISPSSSVHNLINSNSDSLNDSMSVAALAAYNSIIRPWDLATGLSLPNAAAAAAAAATLSQLTGHSHALNSNGQISANNSTLSGNNLTSSQSLALNLGSTPSHVQNTASSLTQPQLNSTTANRSPSSSSLLQLNNTSNSSAAAAAAAAALAASQSPNNKLNVHQLQQLSQLNRFGNLNYPAHLMQGSFASLSHLNAHHQFLASLNSTNGLFTNSQAAAALNAALKPNDTFSASELHSSHSSHNALYGNTNNLPVTPTSINQHSSLNLNNDNVSLMHHLINSNNNNLLNTNSQLINQNSNKALNNLSSSTSSNNQVSNTSANIRSRSINENGKRLNVEDLDEEDCDEFDRDTMMNGDDDDDCDEKCSMTSSINGNGQNKYTKLSVATNSSSSNANSANGDRTSPLSALYELANKNFDIMKTEKNISSNDNNGERINSVFQGNGQNSKKKRKSRTAFTNSQIIHLEQKFSYQRYLTPADRDDLAERLQLTGAQVITWFQNRRAKQKRDNEEKSNDMQAQISTQYFYNKALMENNLPSIYGNIQNIGLFKAAKMHQLLPKLATRNS